MPITAKVIEDSISQQGIRITTLQLMYPRFIHSELMTHRVFSRNASSSRAIPVKKMLEMIRNEPAMPIHWGKNQPGMQADDQLIGENLARAKELWLSAANCAAGIAEDMMEIGLHKQIANRILEPFQHISVVLTATEFSNFFALRCHPDAQPEIQALANYIQQAMEASKPKTLLTGQWHLPYVTEEERNDAFFSREEESGLLMKLSAARCCRVSYLKHDGTVSSIAEDLDLCDKLTKSVPIHASPFEHQATPDFLEPMFIGKFGGETDQTDEWHAPHLHGNFHGWIQHRKLMESKLIK